MELYELINKFKNYSKLNEETITNLITTTDFVEILNRKDYLINDSTFKQINKDTIHKWLIKNFANGKYDKHNKRFIITKWKEIL